MTKEQKMLEKSVVSYYTKVSSLRETARHFGIGEQMVLKTLSNKGVSTSVTHKKVLDLWREGRTIDEIANAIGKKRAYVECRTPRARDVIYGVSPSANAVTIQRSRERKKQA